MIEKFKEIIQRFEQIEVEYQDPSIGTNPQKLQELGKARAELEPKVALIRQYQTALKNLKDAQELLNDPEMRDMAEVEIEELNQKIASLDEQLKLMLIPKDINDDKPVIIEIRPAAGGDEAGLFVAELFRMYTRYAERKRWKYSVMDYDDTGIGGASKIVFSIDASGAYSQLKHESGVHRVQRVPATESGGRIHTSTITVAVLPEAEDVDVDIKQDELEISTFISSSAGGQHMQKNETAIRIIHKPTGIVVTCQDERSQAQNKLRAIQVLKAKIVEAEQQRLAKERGDLRKGQIGSGDRSEKIRTYNFPQSRITDHRIGFTEHNLLTFMDGDIQDLIDALIKREMEVRLAEAI